MLADLFESIRVLGIRCVVISDTTSLPSHSTQRIILVYDPLDQPKVASIPNLYHDVHGDYSWKYRTSGADIPVLFVPKGAGLLPDKFCAEIIARAGWENGIPVPEQRYRAAINLYFANRCGLLKLIFCGNQLLDIVEYIESITGSGVNVSEIEPMPTIPPQYAQLIASARILGR